MKKSVLLTLTPPKLTKQLREQAEKDIPVIVASLVVLSAILICGYDPWAVDPLFPALLLIGAGLFISGQVIRNRYMYYASCIVVPIGFGITRDSWLNADPDYNLLQFAAAILIGLTGAGYALRRQVRRDADKVAKSNDAHD